LWACGRDGEVLEVFAASSLREAFTALERPFEASRPGVDVIFNFAGSQELRTQLEQGAQADIVAVAAPQQLESLVHSGRVTAPVTIATNVPVVVFSNRAPPIESMRALDRLERIVVGAPEVPIGRYTIQIFERLRTAYGAAFVEVLESKIASRELNVRQVLAKVQLGEADAGVVYRTDALFSGLTYLEIPPDLNIVAHYPMAIVEDSNVLPLAKAWMELVRSPSGRAALEASGFLTPAPE